MLHHLFSTFQSTLFWWRRVNSGMFSLHFRRHSRILKMVQTFRSFPMNFFMFVSQIAGFSWGTEIYISLSAHTVPPTWGWEILSWKAVSVPLPLDDLSIRLPAGLEVSVLANLNKNLNLFPTWGLTQPSSRQSIRSSVSFGMCSWGNGNKGRLALRTRNHKSPF